MRWAVIALAVVLAGAAQGDYIPGQVLHLRADGNALDSSGQGSHGTWVGTAAYADGVFGRGFEFDGANNYIETPPAAQFLSGKSEITLSTWIKVRGEWDNHNVFYYSYIATNSSIAAIQWNFDGLNNRLILQTRSAPADSLRIASILNDPGTPNTWSHYVAVINYEHRYALQYKNGTFAVSNNFNASTSQDVFSPSGIPPGDRIGSSVLGFESGNLDDFRIFNRALTSDEIRRLYHSTAPTRRN